jgi:hypothetical protein
MRGVTIAAVMGDGIEQIAHSDAIRKMVWMTGRKYDPACFTSIWTTAINMGVGVVFISVEDGMLTGVFGGLLSPDPFCGEKVASLVFWIMSPDASYRSSLGLWAAFKNWEKGMSAEKSAVAKCHEAIADMDGFFIRQGYRQTETRFEKRLT